jgi:predicted NAD-dependent protein-ADP-ribosyltransferase YbiA (DUF1768 family)
MADDKEPVYFYTRSMPYWGLSNFAPPGLECGGVYWPTVEHYFQAQKFQDSVAREKIRTAGTPQDGENAGAEQGFCTTSGLGRHPNLGDAGRIAR